MMKINMKYGFAILIGLFISFFTLVHVSANFIDPNNPGDTRETAWEFNTVMNITQPFQADRQDHWYRFNPNAIDNTFRLTLTSPANIVVEVNIYNTNQRVYSFISNGGTIVRDIRLMGASFWSHPTTHYIHVYNTNSIDNLPYSLHLRPYLHGAARSPYGDLIEFTNLRTRNGWIYGDFHVNGETQYLNTDWFTNHFYHMKPIPFATNEFSFVTAWRDGRLLSRNAVRSRVATGSGTVGDIHFFCLNSLELLRPPVQWSHTTTPFYPTTSQPVSQAAPPVVSFCFETETLIRTDAIALQYSINGGTWRNFNYAGDNISALIPAIGRPDNSVSFRRTATGMFLASEPTTIIIPARNASAPTSAVVRFDGYTESIFLNDTTEYRFGTAGNWIPVEPGQTYLSVIPGPAAATVQVRVRGTTTNFPSALLSVSVPARCAAPNAVYAPATDNITGVSTAMEFSVDGGDSWTRLAATTLPRATLGNDAVTVYVRLAASATLPASHIRVVEVPAGPADAPTGFEINFRRELLTGTAPGMQWSTNGTTWTNITTTTLNLIPMIPAANAAANANLRIRFAPTATTPPSIPAEISLSRRPATPTQVRYEGFTESIINADDTMEFGNAPTWHPVPAGHTHLPVTFEHNPGLFMIVEFRVRGTDTSFPSLSVTLNIPARRAAPNAVYNATQDAITGVTNAMEFSLDYGDTWTRLTATTIPRATFGQNTASVHVRLAATATLPTSRIRVVEVPAGPGPAPTGFEINYRREMLLGVAPGMQWSTNGTAWNNITTHELNLATMIPAVNAAAEVNLRIRIAPTATVPPSIPAEIMLSRRPATPITANTRFDGFTESILFDDTMEFRQGTTAAWIPVENGQTYLPVVLGTANVAWQVRVRGLENRFPSANLAITVPARRAAPPATGTSAVVFQPASDSIIRVNANMEFRVAGSDTWTRVVGTTIPRDSFGQSATTVYIRLAATAAAAISNVRVVPVPAGPEPAPTGFLVDYAREVLTGVAPGMQWSTNGTTWTNITTTELNIIPMIPAATAAADANLRIRIAPTATMPPSIAAEINLSRRPATPLAANARFDGITESILFDDTMEFRQGTTGAWVPVENGQAYLPVPIGTAAVTWQVRVRATYNRFPSIHLAITVPARRAAPPATGNSAVIYQAATDAIIRVTALMEFSLNGGNTWTQVPGTTIPREAFGNDSIYVYIRHAATAAAAYSNNRIVLVPQGPANAPGGLAIDFSREVVTGIVPGLQWSTNGTAWTNIAATVVELNVATMIPAATAAADVNLQIRIAPTAAVPPSQPVVFLLPRRPAAPVAANVRFDGFTESILLNDTMEYRQGTTGDWIPVANGETHHLVTVGAAAVTWQVRVRATPNAPASALLAVSVPARRAAPPATGNSAVIYQVSTDLIIRVNANMEFSIDGGNTWTAVIGTNIPREMLGQNATDVYVRLAATAAAAASHVRVVAVPEGPANAPAGLVADFNREVVTGIVPGMQWSTNGTAWTNIAATLTELDITPRIPAATAAADVDLQIRFAATATVPASNPIVFTLPRRPTAPVAANVRFDGFTESILINDTMEVRQGTAGDWIPAQTGQANFPVNLGTANTTWQVRVRSTDAGFASTLLTVTVPRRLAAPAAVWHVANNRMQGVTAAMEFSLNSGQTWERSPGTTIPRAMIGLDAIAVYVRVAATTAAAASDISVVQVPQGVTLMDTIEIPDFDFNVIEEDEDDVEDEVEDEVDVDVDTDENTVDDDDLE